MTWHIGVEWIYGRPSQGAEEDEARAKAAAEQVLNAAGVSYETAEAAFRLWEEADQAYYPEGAALVWIVASRAANAALTRGWHRPDGAACSIFAWNTV